MLSPFNFRRATLSIAVSVLLMTGCHPAMSAQANSRIEPPAMTTAAPLRFKKHNFAAHCYNTISCSVVYDNNNFTRPYLDRPTSAPKSPDYKSDWGFASTLGVSNFPPPAEVNWKSKDGVAHEAKVDIGDIFKDELMWHNVPKSEMADFHEGPVAGEPDIFLEVNDHTINVYMSAYVPTKAEQIPGNPRSTHRNDLFLAWSHAY
jgi:hypothetical protein